MGRGKNGTGKILLVTAQLSVYAWRQSSEATCSSQINTARAVAKEFGIQATGKSGVLSWASISLKNSERGTQKVVSEQGTKLDVEISSMIAKGTEVPWIPPTTWFKYLLDHGLWYRLAGLDFEKQHLAPEVWGKFWKQFEALQPDFSLFTMGFSEQELERTCAIFTHGDEGRTLKKNGIMITAVQSVLGYGFDEARLKKRGTKRAANGDELPHLEVNFAGHTFTNRFITSVIPKVLYEQDSDVFHTAMEELTLDLKRLLEDGIRDRHGNVFRVCCIGVKGDWPYLQKVGRLNRAFNTSVKRGAEAKKPRGVCHLCLAGREIFQAKRLQLFDLVGCPQLGCLSRGTNGQCTFASCHMTSPILAAFSCQICGMDFIWALARPLRAQSFKCACPKSQLLHFRRSGNGSRNTTSDFAKQITGRPL